MIASTQPAEGAGGSRSRAAGELTLGLLSDEERGCTPICLCSSVGVSLLAMAAWQPTNFYRMYSVQLWERACPRRLPSSRPISTECTRSNCGSGLAREGCLPADQFLPNVLGTIVGANLLAMAACQPTNFYRLYSVQLWERTCPRRLPASRPISTECTRSNCGLGPGGVPTMAACQPTNYSQVYSIQLCEPDSR
jgi:hypothetical protein